MEEKIEAAFVKIRNVLKQPIQTQTFHKNIRIA